MSAGPRPERIAYACRKVSFSAAHRLFSPHLSDEENQALYGKCYNVHGHGHNYVVEATLRGKVDPTTGMVFNITELKRALETAVMKPLDHKNLDLDIPYFKDHVSTTENLTIFIWDQLKKSLGDKSDLLFEVLVHETDNNTFYYRGE